MSETNNLKNCGIQKWHVIAVLLMICDLLAVYGSYAVALYINADWHVGNIKPAELDFYYCCTPLFLAFCIILFWKFNLYNVLWRQIGAYEACKFSAVIIFAVLVYCILGRFVVYGTHLHFGRYTINGMRLRFFIVGGWLQLWLILGSRFFFRAILLFNRRFKFFSDPHDTHKRAMLIGAGTGGQLILRDLAVSGTANVEIHCIIDDDPNKKGCHLFGVPVVGGRDDILLNVKKYEIDEILFGISEISAEEKRDVLNICQAAGVPVRVLPGISSLVNGEFSVEKMRNVSIEDLLGRPPVKLNVDEILNSLQSKVVLVTGGGGSIGSELCRQIARHNPKQLIIFDIYENNAYDIEQELRRTCKGLNLVVAIGSVRDSLRVNSLFDTYHPNIVFHAAAHKHVPLMEGSPCEAIKNNALGTYKTALIAMLHGCEKFVLISTDKAVNPTNVMGASKRLCELVIQTLDKVGKSGRYDLIPAIFSLHDCISGELIHDLSTKITRHTEFVAVRFGNVLGSNGSVIPLFKKQIETGGPVTVTHPDIIRYFMTIPEAVSLVLEAATYAKGGEIFVLDMGEPVKIDDLARNLIRLSGYTPDVDIKIQYSGLRPGEKLFEERLMSEEGLQTTANKLIHIAKPLEWEIGPFFAGFEKLAKAAFRNETDIRTFVKEMVSTYRPEEKK